MSYTPIQGLTVAMFNSEISDDLIQVTKFAQTTLANLRSMGFDVVDRTHSPHSRACGFKSHEHGIGCSADCPTCLTNYKENHGLQTSG